MPFRSNPLYNDNDSYFPGNPRDEPTSSVFGLASTQSDNSLPYPTMTNSNENKVSDLQNETPILLSEKIGPTVPNGNATSIKDFNKISTSVMTSQAGTDSTGM